MISEISRVSNEEWQKIMPLYKKQLSEWNFIPTYALYILIAISLILINIGHDWLMNLGIISLFFTFLEMGSRGGNIDGFQIGYEWGKENAIEQVNALGDKYELVPRETADS